MLDNYIESQNIIYQTIINSVKKDTLSHAYLIELNDDSSGLDLALAISKFLLCPNHNTNSKNCSKCDICHQVDTDNYIELKIIKADGNYIKKNQIQELQSQFRKISLNNNYKIYIICEAEKLNEEAANSMLKFLEEPVDGIIAILLTSNINQIYNTIKSRCQILKMKKNKEKLSLDFNEKINNYIFNGTYDSDNYDEFNEFMNTFFEYYLYLESNNLKTIVFKNKNYIQDIKNVLSMENYFKLSIIFYKDVLNCLLNKNMEFFDKYFDIVKRIADSNSEASITKKLNILIDASEKIKYNANINLLFDKIVILFSEV